MKAIVVGSRTFDDYSLLEMRLLELFAEYDGQGPRLDDLEIISGGAPGADRLAERFALEYNLPLHVFDADWDKHGKAAGPIRNLRMVQKGNVLVAFWDGSSRGTKHAIDTALEYGLEVHVYRF